MTFKTPTAKQKKDALVWTSLVTDAVARAKSTHKKTIINVGHLKTAFMLQDTLTSMALSGEDAAWNVEVRLNTLH